MRVRLFQSTRPVWGATTRTQDWPSSVDYFNPRAPCGARRVTDPFLRAPDGISIHAPRVGRDEDQDYSEMSLSISIHAPRVGRDVNDIIGGGWLNLFQSTRPVWGATYRPLLLRPYRPISIHAPRVGRDGVHRGRFIGIEVFQSTRPVWGATGVRLPKEEKRNISIHAPRVGRDGARGRGEVQSVDISIHAPRVGRDSKFDDFTPSNLHKRYKRVLARPKNTREKGKIKQKLAYIHAFSAFLGCEGSGTFCALVLRTQYR